MQIERNLETVEALLSHYESTIGADFSAYRNHVYRVINLCFSLADLGDVEREKVQIAAVFHDLGIWTEGTLDYLEPSAGEAVRFLQETGKPDWEADIVAMIEMHHGIHSCAHYDSPLVDFFRRADIADFSLGMVPMGLSRELIAKLKVAFPNAGFHKRLLQLGCKWFLRHPLNPLPMFRR